MEEKELLSYWVMKPEAIEANDLNTLKSLVDRYPYFQLGHVLLAKGSSDLGKEDVKALLNKAAIYALNRKGLQRLIENESELAGQTEVSEPVTFKPVYRVATDNFLNPADTIIETPATDIDLLESIFVDHKVVDDYSLSDDVSGTTGLEHPVPSVSQEFTANQLKKKKSPQELIAKFIKNDPSITPLRAANLSEEVVPLDMSEQEAVNLEDFATESVAEILINQGKIKQGIRIYEKLMLKVPEKKSYFAEKIKNLNL